MTYNFLAIAADKARVLDLIFENTDLQIFDSYSECGQQICHYRSTDEIAAKFDLEYGGQSAVTLQLWYSGFGEKLVFRKIDLNPHYCKGHTFRYATSGWGMIQLYFGGCQNNVLFHSHIGHFNERGALAEAENEQEKARMSSWNWKALAALSGRLKRQIDKLAVGKLDGMAVLPGADELRRSGVTMRY